MSGNKKAKGRKRLRKRVLAHLDAIYGKDVDGIADAGTAATLEKL